MLIDVMTRKKITRIPHEKEYQAWKSRLSPAQYQAIVDELNQQVSGDEIHTSSWILGADWSNSPFEHIYDVACGRDPDLAAKFFGLILWVVIRDRPETWACGRYEKNGVPIRGLTYFRVQP